MTKIAIIGGGFAGLVMANLLKNQAEITVFEKSRGVGGRMATRYVGDWEFDHGAPFFTVKTEEFKSFLRPLMLKNLVTPWNLKFADSSFHSKIYTPNFPAETCFIGTPRMNSIGKYLAQSLDVKLETKIITLEKISQKWQLIDDKMQKYQGFDVVITTTPAPQAAEILPQNCSYFAEIAKREMLPTFAAMLGFEGEILHSHDWDVAYFQNCAIDFLIANHQKPGRKAHSSLVVFTDHSWAKQNIDRDKDEIGRVIIAELEDVFQKNLHPSTMQVHRWLYAKANLPGVEGGFFADWENYLISCGDWCFGTGVESAFASGLAVCNYLKLHFAQC